MNEGRPAKHDLFKITSNDYAYDSEAVEADEDDSSREDSNSSRGHSREHSKGSSK